MQLSANGAVIQGGVPAVQRRETEVFLERRAFQKRRSHPLFYALCCGGISLFCLFGFFGAPLFPYSAVAMAAAGRDTMMGSSLFGMTAELLRGSLPAADSAYRLLLQLCLLAAAASSAVALACAALAFAAGRTARRLAALSSTLNLLTFGTLSALVLLGAETGRAALPIDALIAFFGTLLIRILCVLTHRRGRGLGNAVLLLLAAAAFTGLCLPASPLKRELMAALGAGASLSDLRRTAFAALFGVTSANLILGILRLGAGRGFAFDLIRFLLQCAAAGAAGAVCAAEEMNFSVFAEAPLPVLLVAAAALLGLVLSAALYAVRAVKNKRPPASCPQA